MPVSSMPYRKIIALCLLLLSPMAFGQVYSWVDENGKKHFGDRIPPQYQDQASEYDVPETNSASAIQPQARRQYSAQSSQRARSPDVYQGSQPGNLPARAPSEPRSCEERKAAYAQSKACFAGCRFGDNNISRCGHCRQMKKPSC